MAASLNWDGIRVFLAIARAGSLNAAAHDLGSNQPTIGRHLDRLERSLGTRLFVRHARGLSMTDDGLSLLDVAEAMEASAFGLEHLVDDSPRIKGLVRVAVPEGLASYIIAPALSELTQSHPDLCLELVVSPHVSDLTRGEADIALRLVRPSTMDLVVRKLADLPFGLYASPNVHEEVRLIGYGDHLAHLPENKWLSESFPDATFVLKSDHTVSRIQAGVAGLGMLVLPTAIGSRVPGLKHRPTPVAPPGKAVWMVVHDNLKRVPRVRVVLAFLAKCMNTALSSAP